MRILKSCFDANRAWAARMHKDDPHYFERLSAQQRPDILWIGCSDARIPPNVLIAKLPGEIFVHRNVGNVVNHTDVNCLSVLQFGVEVLGIKHIIVCGHYGCGGILAALDNKPLGIIDNWLRHIKDVYALHRKELDAIKLPELRANRLSELNVAAQVANVCHTTIVQDAWRRSQGVTVHGWIFSIQDGLLRDLDLSIENSEQIPEIYRMA